MVKYALMLVAVFVLVLAAGTALHDVLTGMLP